MAKSLTVLDNENIKYLESELKTHYAKKSMIDDKIQLLKSALEKELREAENKDGKKYCSSEWMLTRTSEKRSRKLSITKLKQYVTEEIISRCCSVVYSKNQGLIKKPK
jgi:hypothetical protein